MTDITRRNFGQQASLAAALGITIFPLFRNIAVATPSNIKISPYHYAIHYFRRARNVYIWTRVVNQSNPSNNVRVVLVFSEDPYGYSIIETKNFISSVDESHINRSNFFFKLNVFQSPVVYCSLVIGDEKFPSPKLKIPLRK
jgi:hypothetical protein